MGSVVQSGAGASQAGIIGTLFPTRLPVSHRINPNCSHNTLVIGHNRVGCVLRQLPFALFHSQQCYLHPRWITNVAINTRKQYNNAKTRIGKLPLIPKVFLSENRIPPGDWHLLNGAVQQFAPSFFDFH